MRKATILTLLLTSILLSLPSVRAAEPPIMTTFKVEPESITANVGDTITIDVNVYDAAGLYAWQVDMHWDPAVLVYSSHTFGDFFADQPGGTVQMARARVESLMAGEVMLGVIPGVTADSGWLLSVSFDVMGEGETSIAIDNMLNYWIELNGSVWGNDPDEMIKGNGYLTAVLVEIPEADWYEYHSMNTQQGLVEVICFYEDNVTWQYLGQEEYLDGFSVYDTYDRSNWNPNYAEPLDHKETQNSVTEDGWFYVY